MDKECCQEEKCPEGYCDMSGKLACQADQAWSCLMHDKMKAEWEKLRGKNMQLAAEAAVKHSMSVWQKRMEAKDMKLPPTKEMIEQFQAELEKAFKA